MLRLLQGYVQFDSGEVQIDDIALQVSTVDLIRTKMVWVPQNIHLPVDNGLELLSLMNAAQKRTHVKSALHDLGLDDSYLSKGFGEISGGQKQRIVLAVCMSLDREIVLMDEPTSSLDEDTIALLIKLMEKHPEKTVLSATHNQSWLQHADKVIEL